MSDSDIELDMVEYNSIKLTVKYNIIFIAGLSTINVMQHGTVIVSMNSIGNIKDLNLRVSKFANELYAVIKRLTEHSTHEDFVRVNKNVIIDNYKTVAYMFLSGNFYILDILQNSAKIKRKIVNTNFYSVFTANAKYIEEYESNVKKFNSLFRDFRSFENIQDECIIRALDFTKEYFAQINTPIKAITFELNKISSKFSDIASNTTSQSLYINKLLDTVDGIKIYLEIVNPLIQDLSDTYDFIVARRDVLLENKSLVINTDSDKKIFDMELDELKDYLHKYPGVSDMLDKLDQYTGEVKSFETEGTSYASTAVSTFEHVTESKTVPKPKPKYKELKAKHTALMVKLTKQKEDREKKRIERSKEWQELSKYYNTKYMYPEYFNYKNV
jgi:hypothetical protein